MQVRGEAMRLDDGEVHVWKVRLPEGPGWTLGDASALALRRILGPYVGAEPGALRFRHGRYGKPALDLPHARTVHFNLSHARDLMLVAVSRSLRVGVDVERIRKIDHGVISRSWFSPEEQRQLEGLPHSQRRRAFFHAWARKEAYIKAIGLGLAMPLDRFSVSVHPEQAALLSVRGRTPRAWHLRHLPVGPSHAAALATSGRPTRIAVQELR
jgi:4'-phosphopantetheinyl transferase